MSEQYIRVSVAWNGKFRYIVSPYLPSRGDAVPAEAKETPDYQEHFLAVQRFQAGDAEASLLMLEDFKDFLEGFVLLLRGGPVKTLTWSHRIFLSNFVKNSGLANSLKSRSPIAAAYIAAESALTTISIQLRPIDTADLRQDIAEVFLATLKRYRSRNNQNFLIPYIRKSFPYALTRHVQKLIKDPLVNLASDKILSLESLDEVHNRYADYHPLMNHLSVKEVVKHLTISPEKDKQDVDYDELGSMWLRGETCDDRFLNLSYAERKILVQFYHLEMTDAEIAEGLGVSYNTAIRRRHLILDKLRGTYVPPSCRYCGVEIPKAPLGRQPRQCGECRSSRRAARRARRKTEPQSLKQAA